MQNFINENKILWNKRAQVHRDSSFYDVEGFKAGKSSLNFIEIEELGDVKDKSLLHLQCHFGLDTLSWARSGANCVGIDFSDEAIKTAEELNDRLNLEARFLCSDIYDLKENLNEKFDIVFTSYGVIGWLPDLNEWGEIISHFLKPGGIFYMVEFHPVSWMLDDNFEKIKYSYFNKGVIETESSGSYADRSADINQKEYGWNHSLSDVINPLVKNGLEIIHLNEFSFSVYGCFPNTVKGEDGFWRIKGYEDILPMMFSVKAKKKFL